MVGGGVERRILAFKYDPTHPRAAAVWWFGGRSVLGLQVVAWNPRDIDSFARAHIEAAAFGNSRFLILGHLKLWPSQFP